MLDAEPIVREEVVAIAAEHDLPVDWLYDAARAFLPGEPDRGAVHFDVDGLPPRPHRHGTSWR